MRHVSPALALAGAAPLLIPGPAGLVPAPRSMLSPSIKADANDPRAIISELQRSFEAFKRAQDEKLAKKTDDVVVNEKIDRINAAVDGFQAIIDGVNARLEAMSVGTAANPSQSPEDRAYASDFMAYFRGGENEAAVKAAQRSGIRAAMSVGSSPDGGYLAPIEWDRSVTGKLKLVSPMRQVCSIIQISTAGFTKVFQDRAVGSGWVGETAARPQTSNPQFSTLTFTPGEIYANPAASQQLLDDAVINVEDWLAGEVQTEFARQEGIAFISGNGVNKPNGMLGYATGGAFAATHPFGAIKVVNSGSAAALTTDGLVDLVYDLPTAFTGNARFASNRRTMRAVRKFKDTGGQYLWQPSLEVGAPATVLGFPIVEMPDMPDIAAGALPIAFGDFAATYLIIDRVGIRVLRDPYTNKPFVSFYTTKRVGGGVINPEPMRFMLISA